MPLPAESREPRLLGLAAKLDEVGWVHHRGPYQALDLCFGVRSCDAGLGDHLAALFAPFCVGPSSNPVTWLSALDRGEDRGRRLLAYLGGRRLVATNSPPLVVTYLLWALNQKVVASARGALLIHAAAAERDGAVVVLPAAQASGKTTLVAGLLRRGYRYVTDEVFAVDIASGRVRPYPKTLGLERGSWALFPELRPPHQPYLGDQWHIPPSRLGASTAHPGAVPRVVLSPRYEPGGPTVVSRSRPAEGLILLVENSFNGADWGQAGLTAAAALVQGCPVIGTLTVGDLDAACDLVDQAVDEAVSAGG